jgi:hypothetical protein
MKFFSKKPETCFFCQVTLSADNTFTLQYSSAEGVHTAKMCGVCSKTFDELADMKEELYDSRFKTI